MVFVKNPVISTITNFMYCIGTGNFGYLNTIFQRDTNNDIHNVLSWTSHILSAIIFYFVDAPILNFLYQIFLGTVIQHSLWMFHNYHKKKINHIYLFLFGNFNIVICGKIFVFQLYQ